MAYRGGVAYVGWTEVMGDEEEEEEGATEVMGLADAGRAIFGVVPRRARVRQAERGILGEWSHAIGCGGSRELDTGGFRSQMSVK